MGRTVSDSSKPGQPFPLVGAVIVAAGDSRRMGGVDKVFAPLDGRPLIFWAAETCHKCSLIHRMVIVVSEGNLGQMRDLVMEWGWSKTIEVCMGGQRRQDSVAEGLERLADCDWIVIHDGARPFLNEKLLEGGLEAARETGAAIAAVPVTDTIKIVGSDWSIQETPARQQLWAAQTPQVFRTDIITAAYSQAEGEATDDACLVEQMGHRVKLYMGSYDNLKITTPEDLVLAEAILRGKGLNSIIG